jgi:hypothetical protein
MIFLGNSFLNHYQKQYDYNYKSNDNNNWKHKNTILKSKSL